MPYVKQYKCTNHFISLSKGDNCFEVGGKVAIVRNILCTADEETHILYELFENVESFHTYPLDTTCLSVYEVSKLSKTYQVACIQDLTKKFVLLPFKNKYVAMPQLHMN